MKLYTKSDLERAARLSLLHRVRAPEGNPEDAIREAVAIVASEGPEYLSREQAVAAAVHAANLGSRHWQGELGDKAQEYAEQAVRKVLT